MSIETIGVVGAGVMGAGVSHCFAEAGFKVVAVDASAEALERAGHDILRDLRLYALFKKSRTSPADVLRNIAFTTDFEQLRGADFVVENVTERWSVKEPIYRQLDVVCPPHAVFAANTSCIPITRIAATTTRPARVLGIHFMNPAPLINSVEMVRGHYTSDATIAEAIALMERIDKRAVVVNDSPGFVSNRVLMLAINEAIFVVHERVASAEDVDRIFTSCFAHKTGPLRTADLIGLDTILLSLEVLYESFSDSKYRPCPLLRRMVDAGLLGRKSGQGFFTYGEGQ
jgi:3-hydroxybutyryl-CoA dehydrogenase